MHRIGDGSTTPPQQGLLLQGGDHHDGDHGDQHGNFNSFTLDLRHLSITPSPAIHEHAVWLKASGLSMSIFKCASISDLAVLKCRRAMRQKQGGKSGEIREETRGNPGRTDIYQISPMLPPLAFAGSCAVFLGRPGLPRLNLRFKYTSNRPTNSSEPSGRPP